MNSKRIKIFFLVFIFVIVCGVIVFAASNSLNMSNEAPIEANEAVNNRFNKIVEVIKDDLEQETNQIYESSRFSLGNVYRLNYIKKDILNSHKSLDNFNDYFEESNEWLYIVNYDNKSTFYICAAIINGKYDVAYFSRDADAFDETLKKNNKLNNNSVRLLSYGNREYYFVNDEGDTIMVPYSINKYNQDKDMYDIPMEGKKLCVIMSKMIEKEIERQKNNEPIQYGNFSVLGMYYEN